MDSGGPAAGGRRTDARPDSGDRSGRDARRKAVQGGARRHREGARGRRRHRDLLFAAARDRPRRSSTGSQGSARRSATGTTSSATSAPTSRSTRSRRPSRCGGRAADIDQIVPMPDPRPEARPGRRPAPAPGAATPRSEPVHADAGHGAAQFVNAHPTWDGRGVTIGIVDTGIVARPSEPAHDEHRRAQDHRLGHRHRPASPTTTRRGSTCRPGQRRDRSRRNGNDLHRARGGLVPHRPLQRARPAARRRGRQRRQPRRQPRRHRAASSPCSGTPRRTRSGGTRTRTVRSPTRPR